jgi:TRAP-type mannitol/chloroaromatic compound transport system permease small subunit
MMAILHKIFNMIDWVNEWVGKVCFPLILVISAVVLLEIVMRFFSRPTMWSFEMTQYLFAICSLLPGGLLQKNKEHVMVDLIYGHVSPKKQVILDIITFPFFLLFVGAMAYFGSSFAYESFRTLETSGTAWDPYVFPIKMMLPIGAILLLLQGIVNLVRGIEEEFFGKGRSSMGPEIRGVTPGMKENV